MYYLCVILDNYVILYDTCDEFYLFKMVFLNWWIRKNEWKILTQMMYLICIYNTDTFIMHYIFVRVTLNMYMTYNNFDLFNFFSSTDSYTDERIKLNVNYDERHGVRTVPVPVSKTNGDQDSLHSLWYSCVQFGLFMCYHLSLEKKMT